MKSHLPDDLKEHLGDVVLSGMLNYKIRVKTTPDKNQDVRMCLNDVVKEKGLKINRVVPYIVSEKPLHVQAQYRLLGQIIECTKLAVAKLGEDNGRFEIVPEFSTLSCYIQHAEMERPLLIGEVTNQGDKVLNERNIAQHLKMEKAEFLALDQK